jgi:hypothetical protein
MCRSLLVGSRKQMRTVVALVALVAQLRCVASADGFMQPVAENDMWQLYQFAATLTQDYTSNRAAPEPNELGGPGTTYTATGRLWDDQGNQLGISLLSRFIVAEDHPIPGQDVQDSTSNLVHFVVEFGSPESSYYDDSIHISKVWKGVANVTGMTDYDSAITGGTGRFLGATGDCMSGHIEYLPGTSIPVYVDLSFRVWVPKLPMPSMRR